MTLHETGIQGLLLLEPKIFGDDRGYFFESYHKEKFDKLVGYNVDFVQDNESCSEINVLRGLHFQLPPFAQGKLVRVARGNALDVALDLRSGSDTFGKYFSVELNNENKLQLWIPPGFAHGFIALETNTVFQYKCTAFYSPENERCILWNDQELQIDWKTNQPKVSEKDKKGVTFTGFKTPF